MASIKPQYIIFIIWLIGFSICLLVLFLNLPDIPNYSEKVLNQIIDTFSSQLMTMLAFIFSDQVEQTNQKKSNQIITALAIILSVIYIILFSSFMINFHLQKITASEVIELFENFRPKVSFLITAVIAYYFATRK